MAISSSIIITESLQASGKTRTREKFTTDAGTVDYWQYDRDPALDKSVVLAEHAAIVWNDIVNLECRRIINIDATPVFVDATKSDLISYVREAYRAGEKDELVPIARWILNRITDGTVTDTQVQNAFGLTAGQWTTLKTKMQNIVAAGTTIETAVGE